MEEFIADLQRIIKDMDDFMAAPGQEYDCE